MLEVVFDNSAAGTLKIAIGKTSAQHYTRVGILATDRDGRQPPYEERERLRIQAEERERQRWAETIPLPGRCGDVIGLPLALSVGEIDEAEIGPKREAALTQLASIDPLFDRDLITKDLNAARTRLDTLIRRVAEGEEMRIWVGRNPDDICGLHWLMGQLTPIGWEHLAVTLVKLPDFEQRPDGTLVRYRGWGEVESSAFGRMSTAGEQLPTLYLRSLAEHWQSLMAENTPLRAVLNGQLVGVPASFYDPLILRELETQKDAFWEGRFIGHFLGKYDLGISDAWVALRLARWIEEGRFEVLTTPGPGDLLYHRMIRQRNR